MPASQIVADYLEKPLQDNRTYRVIKLSNELEALLIHDPDTDKASAALDNGAGSFSDDGDLPGMAHAVEHLLFMGTKKVGYGQSRFSDVPTADEHLVSKRKRIQPIPVRALRLFQCLYCLYKHKLLL